MNTFQCRVITTAVHTHGDQQLPGSVLCQHGRVKTLDSREVSGDIKRESYTEQVRTLVAHFMNL